MTQELYREEPYRAEAGASVITTLRRLPRYAEAALAPREKRTRALIEYVCVEPSGSATLRP